MLGKKLTKNSIILYLCASLIILLILGGVFIFGKRNSEKEIAREEEKILPFLTTEQLKDDYRDARTAEEKIREGGEILLPYIRAGFYWKVLAESTGEDIFYEKSIEAYLAAIEKFDMQYYMPYANLGGIYRSLGESSKAEEMYKKALEIVPGEAPLYIRLAELYRYDMEKTPEEILAVYDEGVTRVLGSLPLILAKTSYLRDIGRKEEALNSFQMLYESTSNETYRREANQIRTELGMTPL